MHAWTPLAGAARDTHLAWNWAQLQQLLLDSACVRLVLSGHDHMGGYAQHRHIHFVTVEAMLEGEFWDTVLLILGCHVQGMTGRGLGMPTP